MLKSKLRLLLIVLQELAQQSESANVGKRIAFQASMKMATAFIEGESEQGLREYGEFIMKFVPLVLDDSKSDDDMLAEAGKILQEREHASTNSKK